ncbi:hypothetical protein [Cryobacterium sp. TMT4-31]|uniref:hypothetical protein n=1 Tax=Cryobacterium sp. TMT4-31 TaxID=1259259 RepID=UPI00106C8845|nr:hypothetical protein [Cryobacterium sp. TMT4-31]TFC87770.1 hypothetical protein E3T19_11605 [Cryobacterium sp. TMT4-31]
MSAARDPLATATTKKQEWWNQWSGGAWLSLAVALLGVSLGSTFIAFISGFNFDPNDYPESHYAAKIPVVVAVMIVSVLIPILSAAASLLSVLARPIHTARTATAVVTLFLALILVWACWVMGIQAIQECVSFAEHVPA